MPTYKEQKDINGEEIIAIERTDEDGKIWSIPLDPANSDYQRYLRWLENPNEVEHLTEISTGAN